MPFETPLTIKGVIEKIHRQKYLLPAIQREFVWDSQQIIKLFDSLLRGYPIGSFLFWSVKKEKIRDFKFYEFIRQYHERDNKHNPKASVTGEEDITVVLDGQQRLTALYIAIKGTYAYKMPKKYWRNNDAFPTRKMYLNLKKKPDDFDLRYNFNFMTQEEVDGENKDDSFWFEVGKILEFEDLQNINKYLRDSNLIESEYAEECLFGLWKIVTQALIVNYYLEESQELDKVLNIFIRVNSGGTVLSYSDLLLSIATAQWQTKDAREEIHSFVDEINKIGNGFRFNKDFVLKSCLVLTDMMDIAFKVDNFNSENMGRIEDKWPEIKTAIKLSIELTASMGYSDENLTSANALIPIAYYILHKSNPLNFVQAADYREDRQKIKKWLAMVLIKKSFGGQPDNVLRPLRKIIQGAGNGFPLESIIEEFKGTNKSITFSKEDIDALLYSKYGQGHTFSVLALLYPTLDLRNRFHMDHIFPKDYFKKKKLREAGIAKDDIDFYQENYNYIGNLQLLEGQQNEEKSNTDFKEWLERNYRTEDDLKDYKRKHYIPTGTVLEFTKFDEFINKREELLKSKLKEILQ